MQTKTHFLRGIVILLCVIGFPVSTFALTSRVSINTNGIAADNSSYPYAITPDSRFALFSSYAGNLVAGDTNNQNDIFVRDAFSGTTIRVNIGVSGNELNNDSALQYTNANTLNITDNGRYVLFYSAADNVVPDDTNWQYDIFVRDLRNNTTILVSSDSSGNISNGYSYPVSMSADGRYVLFYSDGNNLVPGDTNANSDVFVKDLISGTTTRVSVDTNGVEGNSFSNPISLTPDGRYALFVSTADNFASGDNNSSHDVFVRDMQNNTTILVTSDSSGNISNNYSEAVGITPDGKYVLFQSYGDNLVPGDTNGTQDVFVRDIVNSTTVRISTDDIGNEGNNSSYAVSMTSDGRYVLFNSDATNLVPSDVNRTTDAFVRDIQNNTTTKVLQVSLPLGFGFNEMGTNAIAMSSGGRYILFNAQVQDYYFYYTTSTDLYISDTLSGTVSRVDVDLAGTILRDFNQNPSNSYGNALTPDGKYVLFYSDATNLVANDLNGETDTFVNQRQLVPGASPIITNPADGSYRNTLSDITVEGIGNSGSDIRVTFLGNQFATIVDSNGEWALQLPSQLDATYTVYAQQKNIGDVDWSLTGMSTFTIDTSNPVAPTIITPIENQLVTGGNLSVFGVGEIGGSVTVKVGLVSKIVSVDGMGNWSAGPFTIAPGYKYAIVAKQSDIAGNQSNWSEPRTIYGVVAGTLTVSDSDYIADLLLTKKGVSGTGSLINTNPSESIRYTLDYLNVGNGYATGVIIYEEIPTNTCFTIGSISGLNSDYVVEYSNNKGLNYAYLPAGIVGSQDCTITNFRVKYKIPYEAKMNVVSDDFGGNMFKLDYSNELSLQLHSFEVSSLPGMSQNFYRSAMGDFNNDGTLDVVGFGYYGNPSRIYLNQGTGIFIDSTLPGGGTDFRGGEVADFDNDGDIDIIGFGNNSSSKIYVNQGTGVFIDTVLPGGNTSFVYGDVVDIDGDTDVDIVGYGYLGASKVFINQGTGVFVGSNLPGGNTIFYDGDFVDFNSDGYVDIVGYGFGGVSKVFINQGTGVFVGSNLPGGNTSLVYGDVADIDGDTDIDIIGYGYGGVSKVYTNQGTGVFVGSNLPGGSTDFRGGGVVDIDADGDIDLVGYGYGGTSKLYLNQGTGLFAAAINIGGINYFGYGDNLDIDADGDIDLVGYGYGGVSKVYINQGTGLFTEETLPGGVGNFLSSSVGDFNNDGTTDFIGFNFNGYSQLFLNIPAAITGTYNTILHSTGNLTTWDKIIVQEEKINGENKIEYEVYGVLGGNTCDIGNILTGPTESINNEINISTITGSDICLNIKFSILTGSTSPIVKSIIGTWNNEDIDSFTFDVKVNTGNFVGTTVTNTAYISSNVVELNAVNNSDSHILNGLPSVSNGGGYGGGLGGNGGGGNSSNGGGKQGNKDDTPKTVVKNDLTPQQIAEKVKEERSKEVKVIDTTKPDKPTVEIPKPISLTSVEITPTTPNLAIKDAIVQTSYVSVGSTVEVKTVSNPALGSEKKCYTPKEVVDITLGKNTTNKDQLVYQALLKSYDLTMFSDTDTYMPENGLKRYEAAKMFTNFAKHVLCREATAVYANSYTDIEGIDETLRPYIIQAYEYGILKGSNNTFRPLDKITRKEFVAALMRMFINTNMDIDNGGNNWDVNYQSAFKSFGLESIVGVDEEINRYAMSKIMYKLYYNTTYEWTEKGYVLPYVRN